MLESPDEPFVVKLIDFGLSKVRGLPSAREAVERYAVELLTLQVSKHYSGGSS